jgi:hypothetical protein
LDEFRALVAPKRGTCSIAVALSQLDDPEAEKLRAALAADWLPHTAIQKWLAGHGVKVAEQTVGRHRNGKCSCD